MKSNKVTENLLTNLISNIDALTDDIIKNKDNNKHSTTFNISSEKILKSLSQLLNIDYNDLLTNYKEDILNTETQNCINKGNQAEIKPTKNRIDKEVCEGTALFDPFVCSDNNIIKKEEALKKCSHKKKNRNKYKINKEKTPLCMQYKKMQTNDDKNIDMNNKTLISSILLNEYNDEQNKKRQKYLAELPTTMTNTIFDILNDKETHAYRFIDGQDGIANPAVEVIIDDIYNIEDSALLSDICNNIKNLGGFSFVTVSTTANINKLTFYLVLS